MLMLLSSGSKVLLSELIEWLVIYPMESAIHYLNNWGPWKLHIRELKQQQRQIGNCNENVTWK